MLVRLLKNSSLNPACAQFQKKEGWIVAATKLSDVASAIAPIAMMASVFIPAVAAVNKGLLLTGMIGLAGVSSMLSTFSESLDKGKLDMDNLMHRKLVLKSVCEYRKIRQNVDYINFINSGRSKIVDESKDLSDRIRKLEERFKKENPQLRDLVEKYSKIRKKVDENKTKILVVQNRLRQVEMALASISDPFSQCKLIYPIAKGDLLFNSLNLPSETSTFDISKISVFAVIAGVKENQKRIVAEITAGGRPNDVLGRYKACGNEVDKWIENSSNLLKSLLKTNDAEIEILLTQLRKEPAFIQWSKDSFKLEKERQLFERVLIFMGPNQNSSTIVAEVDLNLQVESLEKLLMGKGSFSWKGRTKSLAGTWLSYILEKYEAGVYKFETSFKAMNMDVNGMAIDVLRGDKRLTVPQQSESKRVMSRHEGLANLNAKLVSKQTNPKAWENACLQLADLDSTAGSSKIYLKNVEYFCNFLESQNLKRPFVDDVIISICWGNLSVRHNVATTSQLQRIEKLSEQEGSFEKNISIVKSKLMELKCAEPRRPVP